MADNGTVEADATVEDYASVERFATAMADQMSALVELCADTNASVKRTEATVGQLAEVLKSFAEVNPQELMGLLGGMMGK